MTRSGAFLDLAAAAGAQGTVVLPGSKSISNRTLLLAALASGSTEVRGLLDSDDTARMLDALAKLGVRIERTGTSDVIVHGAGGRFPVKDADLFLGNAGTAFRPLTAVLALSAGRYRLSGVARMHERPIGDLIDALRSLGARVAYTGNAGFPPLAIAPFADSGAAAVAVRGSVSSQFLTALLMAAPLAGRALAIDVAGELISKPYIEITLNLMARFGVTIARQGWSRFTVPAGAAYRSPGRIHVEGDASSASYFLAAGAIGVGPVRVEGVGRESIQGDVRFTEALAAMGADVTLGEDWIEARGIAAAHGERLRAIDADFNHIPDAAMTIAALALFADGPSVLRNIASWRVKETDRIAAMAAELGKLGATVEAGDDHLRIAPPARPRPHVAIDTYDDHRMAMCFSLMALGGVPVRINDPGCVAKTFPAYFDEFARLTRPGPPVIAIDGPSASGKGTVAQRVAAALGMHYLDSGALYRIVAAKALRAGASLDDEPAVAALARDLDVRFVGEQVLLDGVDESPAIRSEAAGAGASRVAALPAVRAALLGRQRAFREGAGLVADGRDIGSVVFPDAKLKVFLVASPEVRAERRHRQLAAKGIAADLGEILAELKERDRRDTTRAVAPLKQMPDAKLLDTTALGIDEAVARVLAWYRALPAG